VGVDGAGITSGDGMGVDGAGNSGSITGGEGAGGCGIGGDTGGVAGVAGGCGVGGDAGGAPSATSGCGGEDGGRAAGVAGDCSGGDGAGGAAGVACEGGVDGDASGAPGATGGCGGGEDGGVAAGVTGDAGVGGGSGGAVGAGVSILLSFLCISSSKAWMSRQRTLASLVVSMDDGCRADAIWGGIGWDFCENRSEINLIWRRGNMVMEKKVAGSKALNTK
jgi:hypothetical protein